MGFVTCLECGAAKVSSEALACPRCGYAFDEHPSAVPELLCLSGLSKQPKRKRTRVGLFSPKTERRLTWSLAVLGVLVLWSSRSSILGVGGRVGAGLDAGIVAAIAWLAVWLLSWALVR